MGATNFRTLISGPSLEEAFRRAQESARWEHGHNGYTGTIAEKRGCQEIRVPRGVRALQFAHWVERYEPAETDPNPKWCRVEEFDRSTPARHRELVRRVYDVYEDKYGPAVVLELKPIEATELRKRQAERGITYPRGTRFWLALGFASE